MKLKKKEDQSTNALVLVRRVNKYSREEIWRQIVEMRLKERLSRDCPTWEYISHTDTKPSTIVDAKKYLQQPDIAVF